MREYACRFVSTRLCGFDNQLVMDSSHQVSAFGEPALSQHKRELEDIGRCALNTGVRCLTPHFRFFDPVRFYRSHVAVPAHELPALRLERESEVTSPTADGARVAGVHGLGCCAVQVALDAGIGGKVAREQVAAVVQATTEHSREAPRSGAKE